MSRHDGDDRPSKKRRLSQPIEDLEPFGNASEGSEDEGADDFEDEEVAFSNESIEEYSDEDNSKNDDSDNGIEEREAQFRDSRHEKQTNTNTNGTSTKGQLQNRDQSQPKNSRNGSNALPPNSQAGSRDTITDIVTGTNLFKIQVDQLLNQKRPDYASAAEPTNNFLSKLKSSIEAIPDQAPLPLLEAGRQLLRSHKVVPPFPTPRPANDVKYKFGYSKPSNINVIGSYALQSGLKGSTGYTVDLVLHMPSTLFEIKDYLNYRYFHKRAFYLACVAAGLKEDQNLSVSLKFDYLNSNPLQPVLLVEQLKSEDQVSIPKVQIVPAAPHDFFPIEKTFPDRNCVRAASVVSEDRPAELKPTPFYNASIRVDVSVNSYLKLLHGARARVPSFIDACILGRIWLQKRGFSSLVSQGGIGGFEWAVIMALLLETGGSRSKAAFGAHYTAGQLFGSTLDFLAKRDLVKSPYTTAKWQMATSDGHPMLFDEERGMNVLFKMTPSSYESLRLEAQASSRAFGSGASDRFDILFNLKIAEPLLQSDLVFSFPVAVESNGTYERVQEKIYEVVKRGLSDRVSFISVNTSESESWPINMQKPLTRENFDLRLSLDIANSSRSVDRGPAAEDVDGIAEFQQFWGEKSELRRFKDGQIRESVVWSDELSSVDLTRVIVMYVLERHFDEKEVQTWDISNPGLNGLIFESNFRLLQSSHKNSLRAYRMLESTIRSLSDLPLSIRQMQPSGIQARNTAVPRSEQDAPTDVVLQFEGSTRWPSDLVAIQMTTMAFLLRLNSLLSTNPSITFSRVGLENELSDILNRSYLEVSISDKTFRIRILHERTQILLQQRLAQKSLAPSERISTAHALAEYKRTFLRSPLHTSAIQKLGTQYPAYSPAARLLKIWFSSHLLSNHFRAETLELISAYVFLHPQPWPTPTNGSTAFLRTLSFLSHWNWQDEPLTLDFSYDFVSTSDMTSSTKSITTNFTAWRKIDPIMNRLSLFIATNFDPDGNTWTEHFPSRVVASRMTKLANAAMDLVRTHGVHLDTSILFKPSLKDYDFVIHLFPPRTSTNGSSNDRRGKLKFRNLILSAEMDDEQEGMKGFEPQASYLAELERLYSDAAMFFANTIDRDVIAGVWDPDVLRKGRKWKVNLGFSSSPFVGEGADGNRNGNGLTKMDVDGEDEGGNNHDVEVVANTKAMLAEMARLGGDLVKSVVEKS